MEFYYQIKGKLGKDDSNMWGSNWSFPPIFSGKVDANNKKEAKIKIEEEYGKKFPLRVLEKDLESNEFLLSIEEIKEGSHIGRLFEKQNCLYCEKEFYVIDKYNDHNCNNKGFNYCSDNCQRDHQTVQNYIRNQNEVLNGSSSPIIYKITNKISNKCYIGKTTQIFTLRWYQHFFQHGNCKFHQEIKNSKVTDWIFEIIEIVNIPQDIKKNEDINNIILDRERYWINHHNSINEGYNSI